MHATARDLHVPAHAASARTDEFGTLPVIGQSVLYGAVRHAAGLDSWPTPLHHGRGTALCVPYNPVHKDPIVSGAKYISE